MTADRAQPAQETAEAPLPHVGPLPSDIVDKWFRIFICGSIASRDTEVFNYLAGVAVVELKRLLAAEKQS